MLNSNVSYQSLDYGTKPTTVQLDTIEVKITDAMVKGYAKAYLEELERRNPVRAQAVALTQDELESYFQGLIAIRVASIHGTLGTDWRVAKQLLIPSFIEYALTCIGTVLDQDKGLYLIPVCDYAYDMNAMLGVSTRLRAFKADGILLHEDAFPRVKEGDPETMSMAILNEYVYSMEKTAHPVASYVAGFLGFRLKEEAVFKALYRVRYDDISYIANRLLNDEKVIV